MTPKHKAHHRVFNKLLDEIDALEEELVTVEDKLRAEFAERERALEAKLAEAALRAARLEAERDEARRALLTRPWVQSEPIRPMIWPTTDQPQMATCATCGMRYYGSHTCITWVGYDGGTMPGYFR